MQGRGLADWRTSAFPSPISLPARYSPSRPQSPSASCTPSPPSPHRRVESSCCSAPLEGGRTRALRPRRPLAPPPSQVTPPLRHLPNPWLIPRLKEISPWTLRRSTSICQPSPAVARALNFLQLVRITGRGCEGVPGSKPRPTSLFSPLYPLPESAVVLDLLLALPEELPRLPCAALVKHMSDTYLRLTAPQPDPAGEGLGPRAENGGTSPRGPEEASQAMPQAPENAGPSEPRSAWQAAGVCPLNPFLVPLEFLGQAATPAR